MKLSNVALILIYLVSLSAYSNEDHDSHNDKKSVEISNQKDHGKEENHSEEDEHGHKEEKNENIGPGKGIVSADEENGFQISPQAEKNFEIKRIKVASLAQIKIPKTAIVTAGMETNIYRYRNGYYRRVDFNVITKQEDGIHISSKELKPNDEIVVHGTGLLRIAELAAFGGAPESHSH
jgi:hypothetical protein